MLSRLVIAILPRGQASINFTAAVTTFSDLKKGMANHFSILALRVP